MTKKSSEKYFPDFIVGGAMKCGTSSMRSILSSRDDVFMPNEEVHFFTMGDFIESSEVIKFDTNRTRFDLESEKKVEWYKSFFEGARSEQLIGEDSTTYLSSRVAPERIHKLLPDVKLVFMLRNPTDRTYSHYMHLVNSGRATMTFEQQLIHGTSSLHLRSLYKPQLERYFQIFSRDQIKVVLFERFIEETQTVVDEMCSFLGLSGSIDLEDVQSHVNSSWHPRWPKTYLAINYAMKGRVDRGRDHWPGDSSKVQTSDASFSGRVLKSLLFRLRRSIPKQKSYPEMDDSLRKRLTQLYSRENRGIGGLVDADVEKYWPFK